MVYECLERTFTGGEGEHLFKITQFYNLTKELLLFGEQLDKEGRTHLQPINEIRNGFDHLTRVFAFKCGYKEGMEDDDYPGKNLERSFGHIYRAAYDTLDWVSTLLRDSIVEELKPYAPQVIQAAIPEYYPNIRPRVEQIVLKEVPELRASKDIGTSNLENFEKYVEITKELKGYDESIKNAKVSLIECQDKIGELEKKKGFEAWKVGVICAVISGIVGGLIGGLAF